MAPSAYSREQIDQFFEHISLPAKLRHAPPSLRLLRALHVHMLAAVPYENLALHYSPTHAVELDPQHLFRKIVADGRGRGGYCLECSLLYGHVLRALGFDAYTAGARPRNRQADGVPEGDYPGWFHIVNIVTLPDEEDQEDGDEDGEGGRTGTGGSTTGSRKKKKKKYHVDVGFGGDGATLPMPLEEGTVHQNLGAQQIRLVRDWIPTQTHRGGDGDDDEKSKSKLWIYQYRNGGEEDRPWNSFYAFAPELEFMPADWEVVNWYISTHPASFQTYTVLAIKFLRRPAAVSSEEEEEEKGKNGDGDGARGEEEKEEKIYGKRMLVNGLVKENLGGRTAVIAECKTDEERVAALEKYFDIRLTQEERDGIKGWKTALG
ncbi:cysteine proteinase [Xylariaceae sp. FL0804]|nr:cysteine proteinase [Xylariaceae sp. FL0804]